MREREKVKSYPREQQPVDWAFYRADRRPITEIYDSPLAFPRLSRHPLILQDRFSFALVSALCFLLSSTQPCRLFDEHYF